MKDAGNTLFHQSLVWDNNLTWGPPDYGDPDQINRFQKCGVDVVSLSVAFREVQGAGFILKRIAGLKAAVAQHENMVLCKTVDDILQANSEKKMALILNFQETLPFEDDVNLIQAFYELGVRHALLAYNIQNHVGGGCAESSDYGLSRFGRNVVREMNRVGMIVDGAHSGYRTTMEAMEICEGPFIFSHTNAHALFPHFRNVKDDQIKACARSGGVIGISGVGEFMDDAAASSESMFRHADYIVQLVGPEHIGIGLDFVQDYEKFWRSVMPETDNWPPPPGGARVVTRYAEPEQLAEVAGLMLKHGYKENDVKGFLGENFLRVARRVWK